MGSDANKAAATNKGEALNRALDRREQVQDKVEHTPADGETPGNS